MPEKTVHSFPMIEKKLAQEPEAFFKSYIKIRYTTRDLKTVTIVETSSFSASSIESIHKGLQNLRSLIATHCMEKYIKKHQGLPKMDINDPAPISVSVKMDTHTFTDRGGKERVRFSAAIRATV